MASREFPKLFLDDSKRSSALPAYDSAQYISISNASVPKLTFQTIYDFMVNRKREVRDAGDGCDQLTSVKSYRSMDRAVSHYQAGDVQQMKFVEVDTDLIYGRAMVLASMKKTRYQVNMAFQNDKPVHAYCQCPIGLAQCCSHVGAFLFAINGYLVENNKENSKLSCTSKKCTWNVPRKMFMDPQPVREMKFGKGADINKQSVLDFDPRHSLHKINDADHYNKMMMELQAVFPKTGMSHLAIIPHIPPPVQREEVVTSTIDPMEEKVQELVYKPNSSTVHLLTPIASSLSLHIEEKTRAQRASLLWLDLHKGRITSSVFGEILRAGGKPSSLIDRIINGSDLERYSNLPKPIQWGIDHEREAVADYIKLQNHVTSLSVGETGLSLLPSHPFIGASGDGKVTDYSLSTENSVGVLEIKCPFSVRGKIVHDMEVYQIVQMRSKDFCLEETEEGTTRLRRNHNYYAQVQGEMAVMGVTWCDFVVWTRAANGNCFIES